MGEKLERRGNWPAFPEAKVGEQLAGWRWGALENPWELLTRGMRCRLERGLLGAPGIRYPGPGVRRPWEILLWGQTLLSKGQGGRHPFGKAAGTCCCCQSQPDRWPALLAQVLVSHGVQSFLTAPPPSLPFSNRLPSVSCQG